MSNGLRNWKFSQVIRFLKLNNFLQYRVKGSHFHYKRKREGKTYLVTVQSHGNKAIPLGTMNSIVRQSGIKKEEWIKFINKNK